MFKLATEDWLGKPADISKIDETLNADVVVIGVGSAGVCAACAAAEEGAKVVAIETTSSFRPHDTHQYGALNAQICKDAGLKVDLDAIYQEMTRLTGSRINGKLVYNLLNYVGPTFDWWYDNIMTDDIKAACVLIGWPYPEHYDPSHDLYRQFPGGIDYGGAPYIEGMNLIEARGKKFGATYRYGVRADQLVTSGGCVTGVIGERTEGGYLQVNASKGVILATGRWTGNASMQRALNPAGVSFKNKLGKEYSDEWRPGGDFTKFPRHMGEGQKMACWVGGWMSPEYDAAALSESVLGASAVLEVNNLGRRFVNEEAPVFERGTPIAYQPGAVAWAIFDDNWRINVIPYQSIGHHNWEDKPYGSLPKKPGPVWTYLRGSDYLDYLQKQLRSIVDSPEGNRIPGAGGQNYAASSLDKLADFMGFDANVKTTFLATVERYNELGLNGHDDDFGKDPPKLNPIKQPPFYASKLTVTDLFLSDDLARNGIITDLDGNCRVIDKDFNVIPGLWAVGDVQGGRWTSNNTTPFCCPQNSFAMAAGRLAGKMAAKK